MSFCEESGVRYDLCGKVVVATGDGEVEGLKELHRRGEANGVPGLELIGPERLRELEPHSEGVLALHSPRTGIVDYRELTRAYAKKAVEAGGAAADGTRGAEDSDARTRASPPDRRRGYRGSQPGQLRGPPLRYGGQNGGPSA